MFLVLLPPPKVGMLSGEAGLEVGGHNVGGMGVQLPLVGRGLIRQGGCSSG